MTQARFNHCLTGVPDIISILKLFIADHPYTYVGRKSLCSSSLLVDQDLHASVSMID